MRATSGRIVNWCVLSTCLVVLCGLAWVPGSAAAAEKVRVVSFDSPADGLPSQEFQSVDIVPTLKTSLVAVANRGGDGHRSFYVTLRVSGSNAIEFQVKEGQPDVLLPLTQPIPIDRVWLRCDSFSAIVCRYTVSLVGE